MTKNEYYHHCRYCNHEWYGSKPVVVSCTRCKRRLDNVQKTEPGQLEAIRFVEARLITSGIRPSIARTEAKRRLNSIIGFGGK